MEDEKLQRLHDTLALLRGKGKQGLGGRQKGRSAAAAVDPTSPLYAHFVREGTYQPGAHIKRDFSSDTDDSDSETKAVVLTKEERKAARKAAKKRVKQEEKNRQKKLYKLQEKEEAKRLAETTAAGTDEKDSSAPRSIKTKKKKAKRSKLSSDSSVPTADNGAGESLDGAEKTTNEKKSMKSNEETKRVVGDTASESRSTKKKKKKSKRTETSGSTASGSETVVGEIAKKPETQSKVENAAVPIAVSDPVKKENKRKSKKSKSVNGDPVERSTPSTTDSDNVPVREKTKTKKSKKRKRSSDEVHEDHQPPGESSGPLLDDTTTAKKSKKKKKKKETS